MSVIRSALLGLCVLMGGVSSQARLLQNLKDESAQLASQARAKMELAQTTINLPNIPGLPDQITIPEVGLPDEITIPDINLPDGINLPDLNLPDINLPDVNLPDLINDVSGNVSDLIDSARNLLPDWVEELVANATLLNSTLDINLPPGVLPNISWPGYPSPPAVTYFNDTLAITVGTYIVALSNLNLTGEPELHVNLDAVYVSDEDDDDDDGDDDDEDDYLQLRLPTVIINDQEFNLSLPRIDLDEFQSLWNSLASFEGLSIPILNIDIPAFNLPQIDLDGIPRELGYSGLINLSLPGWTGDIPRVDLFGFENWTSTLERNENGSVSIILPPFTITIPSEIVDAVDVRESNASAESQSAASSFSLMQEDGDDEEPAHFTDCEQNDLVALNYLLFLKRLQVAHYADALEVLTGDDFIAAGATNLTFQRFQEIYGQDQQHVAVLESLLDEYDGEPWTECNYTFNFTQRYDEIGNANATVEFAQVSQFLEAVAASAYVGVAGVFSRETLGQDTASIGLVDARHSSWINPLLGNSPFPDVFEPAANWSSVYQMVEMMVSECPNIDDEIGPVTVDECEGASFNGTWSAWHACSVSCGGGQTYRDCLVDGQIAENSNCRGRVTQPCNVEACPVVGEDSSTGVNVAPNLSSSSTGLPSPTGANDGSLDSTGVSRPVLSSTAPFPIEP